MGLPTGKKEFILATCLLLSAMLLINSLLMGGLNLGVALGLCLGILCSFFYSRPQGKKPGAYSLALLILSLVIGASFARADDTQVKMVLCIMILLAVNLALCLLRSKNRHNAGTAFSLLDGLLTLGQGFVKLDDVCIGFWSALRSSRSFGAKSRAVLLGLGISLPLLIILSPLLLTADAAFEGLMDLLPSIAFREILLTIILGSGFALILYSRNVALQHCELPEKREAVVKGLSSLTVNTVLTAVCGVYLVYLVSQLAYFSGGFSGILPEEYTLAEYARRGFFEMAWLCALNLGIIVGALWVCLQKDPAPKFTRCLCLFLGIMTLFLVSTASAKMLLYIDSFGLTRLRVLTQVAMVFFGLTTLFVCLWLFVRKLPYMKCVVLTALLLAALVSWADVDTVVARYNTESYLSGKTETVDTRYLDELGAGAVPYLDRLCREAPDENIRDAAYHALTQRAEDGYRDLRGWNYADAVAERYLKDYRPTEPDIRTEAAEYEPS